METAFIDIVGQGSYTEQARYYPVSAQLEVMVPVADSEDIQGRFQVWDEQFTATVAPLRSQFTAVEDGGTKLDIKVDTLAQSLAQRYKRLTRRYRFVAPSAGLRDRLVEAISGIPFSKEQTVDIMIPPAVFEASAADVQRANCDAVEDAHAKAASVARTAVGRVGRILSARQMPPHLRASGAMGDEDWWGQWDSFHIGGGGPLETTAPTRLVSVRFLVRFELVYDKPTKKAARRGD
jgi:hypothetical protein